MQRPMENPRSRWSPVLGPELAGCHSVSHCGPWESHESPGDWTRKFDDARWCKQQEWEYIYTYIYIHMHTRHICICISYTYIYIEYTALYTVYTWSIIIIHTYIYVCVCALATFVRCGFWVGQDLLVYNAWKVSRLRAAQGESPWMFICYSTYTSCNWRYLPLIYIYIWPMQGLNFREHPHKIWPYMVQYLHFRILKFPLRCRELQKKTSPRHQRPSLVRHQWCEETVDDTFPQHASGNWGPVKDHRSQQGRVAGSKVGSDSLLPWKEVEFPLFSGLRSN